MYTFNISRPEQLVLQDDPSFLPEFALPPPELLAELDLGFNLDLSRSGESQSLTPFGSQQSSQSSHVGGYGLVLPSSSPDRPAGVGLEGDNVEQGNNDMLDIDNLLNLEEPDFVFGEDGDIIEFTPGQRAPETPAVAVATGGVQMLSDAGASARVRQEHQERQQGGAQVSFAAASHLFRTASLLARHSRVPLITHSVTHHAHTSSLT
jgi:meiotic recombination protein REC8